MSKKILIPYKILLISKYLTFLILLNLYQNYIFPNDLFPIKLILDQIPSTNNPINATSTNNAPIPLPFGPP